MKNSNDTIGNRNRDLPACSEVPQPTAPQRGLEFDDGRKLRHRAERTIRICFVSRSLCFRLVSVALCCLEEAGQSKYFTELKGQYATEWAKVCHIETRSCKQSKYHIFRVCVCSLRYPACNTHAPYCHLWPAPLYNIFTHIIS